MDKLRVSFLTFGFAEPSVRLASALAKQVDLQFMIPESDVTEHLSYMNPDLHFEPFQKPRLRQPLRQLFMIRNLLSLIRDFKPDIVHIQQGHFWFNLALPLLRRLPVLIEIHDPRYHSGDKESQKTPQWLTDFGFRRATRVIVHGKRLKQVCVEECGLEESRVDIVPLIVHGDASNVTEVPEEDLMVLFFGRIWAYKGLEYLIRAEPYITENLPNVKIVIAGRGDDFEQYRAMMTNPDRFVVHNEFIPQALISELFQRASVVALPYVDGTQSGVLPIAYTFGKPVVATDVGSIGEMVEDGVTGIIVPPRDERTLAEAIVALLRDPKRRHRMGEAAKQKIEAECAPDVVATSTIEVYRQTISDFGKSRRKLQAGRNLVAKDPT